MIQPDQLFQQLLDMPKVELHVHIEGATSPATYFELARKNNVAIPAKTAEGWAKQFQFKDFNHFIEVYIASVSTLKEAEDYAFIIEDFYKHQAAHNILHSEAYLSASFLVERFDTEEILEAIQKAKKAGEEKYGVTVNLIPDIARHIIKTQHEVTDFVIEGYNRGIFTGLGLGGIETNFPPELFAGAFKRAKEAGLRVVAHAGETQDAKSIWGALQSLKAERIGHGIRCVEDEALLNHLATTQVPIEVSPMSNYCTGVVAANDIHPIRQMVDRGLCCTVNSDDPSMFSTSLHNEYWQLAQQGFTWNEIVQLNKNAINAAFISDDYKASLLQKLDSFVES